MPIKLSSVPKSPRDLVLVVATLLPLSGVSVGLAGAASVPAAEPLAFALPADEGYGIDACMQTGSSCGQAIANAFCEAHGHVSAVAFGAADVTSMTGANAGRPLNDGDLMIRCGD